MGASEPLDRYRIESLLGKGGMGEVYKAFDPVLDRTVALKTISSISEDPHLLQRLYVEARACGRLAHPNIVRVYDLHESPKAVYISMEYLEGESLAAAMERGTLALEHKLQILDEILSALHYAHTKNVIHRDVKPSNVHLLPDGHIKLLDFGLARVTVGPTMTMAGSVMGTAPYMSPEQLKAQSVDARTDIYSTGVLAYELLTGHRAFDGEHITAVMLKVLSESPAPIDTSRLGVPPAIAQVVNRAMAKSPDDRYSSAGEMRSALDACAPRPVTSRERWSVTAAQTQATFTPAHTEAAATQLIPGRDHAPSAPGDASLKSFSDPIGGLFNAATSPRAEAPTPPRSDATTSDRSFVDRMTAFFGPRATSWAGAAVLLIAFSLVWAITQLFLSPGTSASDSPVTSVSSQDEHSAPSPRESPPPSLADQGAPQSPTVVDPGTSSPVGNDASGSASPRDRSPVQAKPSPTTPSPAAPSPAAPSPAAPGAPSSNQPRPTERAATVTAGRNDDLSRALADRVREALRQTGVPMRDAVSVSLEMGTRPAPFNGSNGLTGDYVATVRNGGDSRRIEGHVLRFDEVTLRNAVIDEAAEKVVETLTGASPDR